MTRNILDIGPLEVVQLFRDELIHNKENYTSAMRKAMTYCITHLNKTEKRQIKNGEWLKEKEPTEALTSDSVYKLLVDTGIEWSLAKDMFVYRYTVDGKKRLAAIKVNPGEEYTITVTDNPVTKQIDLWSDCGMENFQKDLKEFLKELNVVKTELKEDFQDLNLTPKDITRIREYAVKELNYDLDTSEKTRELMSWLDDASIEGANSDDLKQLYEDLDLRYGEQPDLSDLWFWICEEYL